MCKGTNSILQKNYCSLKNNYYDYIYIIFIYYKENVPVQGKSIKTALYVDTVGVNCRVGQCKEYVKFEFNCIKSRNMKNDYKQRLNV